MKKTRKPIVVKSGNYNTRIVTMMCCGNSPFARQ
jgi:hypothetical protein